MLVQGEVRWSWLAVSCCLLLGACWGPAEGQSGTTAAGAVPDFFWDWELQGSGGSAATPSPSPALLQQLFQALPTMAADSPFVTETPGQPAANCTQRFWLPSASQVCWEEVAGPEEFARSRLLVLQNRAALQAVSTSTSTSTSSGEEARAEVEGDTPVPYGQRVREELRGAEVDHRSMSETMGVMQEVFTSLEEKRREGTEQRVFLSVRQHLTSAWDSIHGRENMADHLEHQLSLLE
ncbi:hypothetical protein CRUP_037019, partial [Coryphaenoides rupestris]